MTYSKDEIINLMIEEANLTYKHKMNTVTPEDQVRRKQLYFLMKEIPKDATWKEAYTDFGRRPRQKGEW